MIDRRSLLLGAAPALIIAPTSAISAAPTLSPEERIDAAMAEIRAALTELYPGCHLSSQARLRGGSAGVVLGAHPLHGYEARYFFCDDPADWQVATAQSTERTKMAHNVKSPY